MPEMTIDQAIELAMQQQQAGQLGPAETIYRQVLAQQPNHPEALHLLGLVMFRRGQIQPAWQLITKAIQNDPKAAHYHSNLAQLLLAAGRPAEALAAGQKATTLQPGLSQAWLHVGSAFQQLGRSAEAANALQHALTLQPAYFEASYLLGNTYLGLGQYENAMNAFRQAAALQPNIPEVHNNLGNALHELGRLDEARASFRQAIALKPDWAMAHYNLGVSLLLGGDLQQGWIENEWRCRVETLAQVYPPLPKPRWDGTDLNGKRILLTAEQGLGDAIQFARYARLLTQRGGHVILQCPPELQNLLRAVDGVEQVTTRITDAPAYDVHCPLLSLPMHFGTTLATIPANIPYVRADSEHSSQWRKRLPNDSFKVGLAWAGGAGNENDRNRSIRLDQLAPLREVDGRSFISLQLGSGSEQVKTSPLPLLDLTSEVHDFSDTAALIDNLDLVITVDTAVAHLAGAMGKQVRVLLQFVPDWRWLLGRDDSPWYPTMRLFRQPKLGDWDTPIRQVVQELQCLK